jgi:hypothetical protein
MRNLGIITLIKRTIKELCLIQDFARKRWLLSEQIESKGLSVNVLSFRCYLKLKT